MLKGVDLSCWQTNVNYQELKNQGVEFVIIRTGYGKDEGQKDSQFETHYAGCKAVGLKVGAYLYSYCTSIENAEKEANNCLSHIGNKSFDLPIYLDLEEQRTAILGKDAVTEIAKRFCNIIKNAGYKAGVYANLNWFNNYVDPYAIIENGDSIWLAQWNNEITANFDVDIWQNTNNYNDMKIDGDILVNESILDNNNIPTVSETELKAMAVDTIYGFYGNGQERKEKLGQNYNAVQDIVNNLYFIIKGD